LTEAHPGATASTGRVALLADPWNERTGIGRYVERLDAGLREAGVDVVRATPVPPRFPGIVYRGFRLIGRDLRAFLTNYPLWSAYPRADTYHLISQTLASLLLVGRPKGRTVVTVHDIFPYMLRSDPELRSPYAGDHVYHRLAMAGLKRADHLIADSKYTKRCLIEHLDVPEEDITVVYLGIDHERFRPLRHDSGIRARYGLPEGRRYLLYVGSEDPRKNLVALVRALAEVRHDFPDVELVKVGLAHLEHGRRRLLDAAEQLEIRGAIRFLEDVPEEDLPSLYATADLYVTPSPFEGFGLTVLEAMACGTPVVCADAGALPEIVGAAAVRVPPWSTSALAEAISRLLESPGRRRSFRKAGLDQAAGFTWAASARGTAAVYANLRAPRL
jgi:glycosyltransferase involved in cell wall biosynthesis